jgi:phage I-like protein
LIPAGYFRARDGRPATLHPALPHWFLDAPAAQSLIIRFAMEAMPLLVDYEHQTMAAEINGQPAPAAGWGKNLRFEADGLYAEVEWTTRAKEMIKAGEYKYLSPVFTYDTESGQVLKLLHVALTNYPALTDLKPVTAKTKEIEPTQEAPMALKPETLAALGLPATADDEAVHTAVTALKNVVANPATPDPSKFVPIAQVEAIKTELVQLKASQAQAEMDALIKQGKDDGRLMPSQESWARTLSTVQLKDYLEQTPAIAALKGNQTGGKAPADDGGELTPEQKVSIHSQLN